MVGVECRRGRAGPTPIGGGGGREGSGATGPGLKLVGKAVVGPTGGGSGAGRGGGGAGGHGGSRRCCGSGSLGLTKIISRLRCFCFCLPRPVKGMCMSTTNSKSFLILPGLVCCVLDTGVGVWFSVMSCTPGACATAGRKG